MDVVAVDADVVVVVEDVASVESDVLVVVEVLVVLVEDGSGPSHVLEILTSAQFQNCFVEQRVESVRETSVQSE